MTIKHTFSLFTLLLSVFSIQAQCWNLIWEDEFNGTSLNTTHWSYQTGAGGWGNNELQHYTDLSTNVNVNNGSLQITAQQESYMGANYTSARIRTINKVDWTFGKMEARIKLPEGQGIWPAFWMMPTNSEYGGWPASGEIDIMEFLGHQTATTHGTIHYGYAGDHQYMGSNYTLPSGTFSGSYHDFAVEWETDEMRWYVDGLLYHTITEAELGSYPWIFDKDFHFILNVAVGGNWPGNPNGSTVFPQTMEVDYVKVYQLLSDISISGDDYVQPGDAGLVYKTPAVSGATYTWSVPPGATITNGQGTNAITINWGNASGNISCSITTGCGTELLELPVVVSANFYENPAFEFDYNNWNTYAYNGAAANFNISTSAPQEGVKSALVEVTSGGTNNWDVQLQRSGFALEAGEDYTLTFYAKAAIPGVQIPVVFIKNQSPWDMYASMTITLTENWLPYELAFTAPVTDQVLMNLDLGNNTTTFHFDNFIFGKTAALLPVELASFTAQKTRDEKVLLEWATYSETGNAYFEVLRRNETGDFVAISRLDGQGTTAQLTTYSYTDQQPFSGANYYQLRQVDFDGRFSMSNIQSVFLDTENQVNAFPNPVKEGVQLEGWKGGLLRVLDSQGKEILRKQFVTDQDAYWFSMVEIPGGTYFLELEMEEGLQVVKLAKEF